MTAQTYQLLAVERFKANAVCESPSCYVRARYKLIFDHPTIPTLLLCEAHTDATRKAYA